MAGSGLIPENRRTIGVGRLPDAPQPQFSFRFLPFRSAAIFRRSPAAGSEIAISPRSQRATVVEITPPAAAKAI
jgi:hypothetical protein